MTVVTREAAELAALAVLASRYTGTTEPAFEVAGAPAPVTVSVTGQETFGELLTAAEQALSTVGYSGGGFALADDTLDTEALAAHLARLAGTDPATPVAGLPVLTEDERETVVRRWNATAAHYPEAPGASLPCLFERWARVQPEHPALRFDGEQLTYAELNRRANRLARHLTRLGAGPETVVGVLFERGPALPTALLAILKAGAAYVPLDPEHPADRLAYLTGDAGCALVLTTAGLAARLPEEVLPICLDEPAVRAAVDAQPDTDPAAGPRPDSLAYVLYTSGSTGLPKGTLVQHASVVNLVLHSRAAYRIGPGDRVLQFANPCFDVSVWDIFGTLCNGATLVQAPRLTLLDPRALVEHMRAERVTVVELPPAVAALLDPSDLPDLRMANMGGEALPLEVARRFRTGDRLVHNSYGPTEVTVTSTDYLLPRVVDRTPPIGRAIANLQCYVLDPAGEPVPVGAPGELLMGGAGVARGYLNRGALTAEKFVPDPFGPPGARLYRTGDLVRWRPDGQLEFLGRIDTQLKVNGIRVEPGEVEAALCTHPDVAAAVVDVRGEAGNRLLVAFLVPVEGATAPDTTALRAHLRGRLPANLIPARVHPVPALPLTLSGKVDRRALHRVADSQ
ncbi:non-ribosomal peptide synthetase [Goodfellowiella coeruleoviolacea]|uniref:Amino acid adenylation domain-containing protein n=1 Tax=Goodfellowiella coeruleoviolacea TaxID=334858 RepID=A0AAE3KHI3_9PSEU|nr:amino acid adenylation domain-containing protein [Goodfellowiella coeruleoviolacea]MCP2166912.1 amino acid adenylation domain-containing protein [Goodfellowiella coeruleoviolacea]